MQPTERSPFNAAPFACAMPDGPGLVWEDPREVHRVVVWFAGPPPPDLKLQYWRTRWPQQRLPKDAVPGGGDVGWWELGNWFTGQWQTADGEWRAPPEGAAEAAVLSPQSRGLAFTFRPVNATEFPELEGFPATYRTTLKLRLLAEGELPALERLEAHTDSVWERVTLTVLLAEPRAEAPHFEAFNGQVAAAVPLAADRYRVEVWATRNPDPNCFDRTLLTIALDSRVTVSVNDALGEAVWVPDRSVCVVAGETEEDFLSVGARLKSGSPACVYDLVEDLPEQTWARAWGRMVRKRERIYLPLAADGHRHKFGLRADGSVFWRTNNGLLTGCPGADSERLAADRSDLDLSFGLPGDPGERGPQEGTLPVGVAAWERQEVRVEQAAFATVLPGTNADGPAPPSDRCGVLMIGFRFQSRASELTTVELPLRLSAAGQPEALRVAGDLVFAGDKLRLAVDLPGGAALCPAEGGAVVRLELQAGERAAVVVKVPYVALEGGEEVAALRALDFAREQEAVAGYWRRRLGEGMKLLTPEADLTDFHRAHAAHLLINCEKEPDRPGEGTRRFARVGSFHYAAFGNESVMMTVDLDRRGYHREARECYEAFMHYQGTAALPGDFSSQEGVLYGACGYEHGGYNQHHGWILWGLVEHFRFTREEGWLRRAAPHILAGAEWIVTQRARTLAATPPADLGAGLLPHGSLEDIGDWWQWLSTNCYTWRGLDAAAWALEQLDHPEGRRLREQADGYRAAILRAFGQAAERSPVVKLRDGSWVPHYPSHVHRRGRAFGWICETLEGGIHLLISGALPPTCREAGWILRDYEDNLHLSPLYGYNVPDRAGRWFDWGGFSMQACLLLDVEPYLRRDDVKHALRAAFNAIAANFFPEVRMIAEHALPTLADYRGDHYKTSDEANAAGWLRYLFVREEGEELLLGQAVPRSWLRPGGRVGVENAATHFGPVSLVYQAEEDALTVALRGPTRNPPRSLRVRFRAPEGKAVAAVHVNGREWEDWEDDWVRLPGEIGAAQVRAELV